MDVLEPLFNGPLTPIPLDLTVAQKAAEIRAKHYHRTSCPLSLADAVLIASAKQDDSIATADPHVLAVAKIEKIKPIALPEQG
jgi:predicted nucleic acid-binding protein